MGFSNKAENHTNALGVQTWARAALLLLICTTMSKMIGFLREIIIAEKFGVGIEVDAYLVAINLPTIVGGAIGTAIGLSLIPIYQQKKSSGGDQAANKFVGSIFCFVATFSFLIMFILLFFSDQIIRFIAPALPEQTSRLSQDLLRHLSVLIPGLSLLYISSSIYNALHHFKIPAISELGGNFIVVLTLVLFASKLGINALVFGLVFSTLLLALGQSSILLKKEILKPTFNFASSRFSNFIIFSLPILFYNIVAQFTVLIENYFASGLSIGSISSLGYAQRLYNIAVSIVTLTIAKAIYPTFSTLAVEKKEVAASELLFKITKQFIIFFVPLSIIIIFFKNEIISLVFMRGAFDDLAVKMTSEVFIYYIAGLTPAVITPFFIRMSYAYFDTKTPLIAAVLCIVYVVISNYFLTPLLGLTGIALNSSISVLLNLLMISLSVNKRVGGLNALALFKITFTSLFCAIISLLPLLLVPLESIFVCTLLFISYFIIYSILTYIFIKEEFLVFHNTLKRVLNKITSHELFHHKKS